MVQITSILSVVAIFSTLASGLPSGHRRQDDSALGIEVAVSAPNGIPLTDSVELASQSAREAGRTASAEQPVMTKESSYGAAYGAGEAPINLSVSSSSAYETTAAPAYTPAPSAMSSAHVSSATSHSSALPSYGSGGANWGNSEFEDCVRQCVATYGSAPVAEYTPTATNTANYGTGATHTVIVAPTQGVLRYIPFAINATVGDTIKFMWGANNHTVTKGSALLPCNKTGDAPFTSGRQDKAFVFTQVVNDTKPTYFFCNTPEHCQKGMFGVINPTSNFDAALSVSRQMQTMASNSSDVKAYADYTRKETEVSAAAAKWGGNLDLGAFPEWAREDVVKNVLYARNFFAKNPEVLKENGAVDLSSAGTTPLVIPQDVAAALKDSTPAASTIAPPAATTSAPAETPSTTTGTAEGLANGALSSASSPRVLVAAMAVLATLVLL